MRVLFVGLGAVGAEIARRLAKRRPALSLLVADLNKATAQHLAAEIGDNATALQLDVHDREELDKALCGVDVIMNAAGPFYRNAAAIMEAAIAYKIDYIDINDDHDVALHVTQDQDFRTRVEASGIRMILGCGMTPGLSNILVRHGIDSIDTVETVRMAMVVPFTLGYSPAVLDHMFHITSKQVTQFIDGHYTQVQGYGGEWMVDCIAPFNTYPSYYAGHGEAIMLPASFPQLKHVTCHLAYYPRRGADIWRMLIDAGFASKDKIPGADISPLHYLIRHVEAHVGDKYFNVDMGDEPAGFCIHLEMTGSHNNCQTMIKTEIQGVMNPALAAGEDPALGDPTPICALIGLEALLDGNVYGTGVLMPELCFDAGTFIKRFKQISGLRIVQEIKTVGEMALA